MMSVKRIVPNIKTDHLDASQEFYGGLLGFSTAMNLGWIMTFESLANPQAQLSVIAKDPSGLHPDLTVEVDNVDEVYTRALARGVQIVYPPTNEPWGVRRFFAVDPSGKVINIMSHKPGDG
jgi:predicted enzyme related to lactoylglutathione lyase